MSVTVSRSGDYVQIQSAACVHHLTADEATDHAADIEAVVDEIKTAREHADDYADQLGDTWRDQR
jgi:hypothetical protein